MNPVTAFRPALKQAGKTYATVVKQQRSVKGQIQTARNENNLPDLPLLQKRKFGLDELKTTSHKALKDLAKTVKSLKLLHKA